MDKLLKEYGLGDMTARYEINEDKQVGLVLYPAELPLPENISKKAALDSLVQVKLAGDMYNGAFAPGNTLRNGESVRRLKFESQECTEEDHTTTVTTNMKDDRGYRISHILTYTAGEKVLRMCSRFHNESRKPVFIEMLASCSIEGISPYLPGDCSESIQIHRLQSRWSQEGRLKTETMEDLQLDTSWTMEAVRCERFGQTGSLPVNRYFPFLAVEDKESNVFWGMQLAHNASWQMEIYREDENIAVSAGLADREFGHWMKQIEPGESFLSPQAIVSVARTDSLEIFTRRLTDAGQRAADSGPACEQELPVIFNEYCTTWGCPSHENICAILEKIKGRGFQYFVIDCGWYKADGVPWDISMGDYIPSESLFPKGLDRTVEAIREAGLKPGIWFEIENVGQASEAYRQTEHLLKLDGNVLTTTRRRFWDMNDPWVQDHLQERVIGTLKKYGFEYMKMDYNDTIGIGCDGCESLGEGLRRNMEAARAFVEKVKEEIPGIVLENCASGGHRLEPGYMALTSMASFSDAHECPEIPIIAANLHRVILPRQSQIWAVIRKTDSLKRIAYSMANTFLGRMCISGDVRELDDDQWNLIDRGIAFYKKIAPVIKEGQTYRFGPEVKSIRHPKGWQGIVRVGDNGEAYVLVHTFHGEVPEEITIQLPPGCPQHIKTVYSDGAKDITLEDHLIIFRNLQEDEAAAVSLIPQ
ncbi:MAG: alpha-galactosidase [Eubacteriales bacterium]|nr:alpha-galactosidase [Eubacteriales bacterium]